MDQFGRSLLMQCLIPVINRFLFLFVFVPLEISQPSNESEPHICISCSTHVGVTHIVHAETGFTFFCCRKEPKQWVSQNNMWSFGECSVWSLQWKVSIKHAIFRIQNTFYTQMEYYLTFRIKSNHFGPSHFADNICCGSHILLFHVCLGIRI